jgi:hypothetical protein
MKGKSLSFAFITFSESGLFNGLRAIQIKNFAPPPRAMAKWETHTSPLIFTPPASRAIAGRENMT